MGGIKAFANNHIEPLWSSMRIDRTGAGRCYIKLMKQEKNGFVVKIVKAGTKSND